MKKILLIIPIFLLVGCLNKPPMEITDTEQVIYINKNINNITKVIVHYTTNGSNNCYNVNINEAYNAINNIKIIKKSNISVTDNYLSYTFIFKNKTKKTVSFEGDYLNYKNNTYTIDNFNKVELNEKNIVKCEY